MLEKLQHPKFFFEDKLFHKLQLNTASRKCVVKVGKSSFNYSQIQLALYSLKALDHFQKTGDPFEISCPSNKHDDAKSFYSALSQVDSLFHTQTQIRISQDNAQIYLLLAETLNNPHLLGVCQKVISTSQELIFKFSLTQLDFIPVNYRTKLFDYKLVMNQSIFQVNNDLFQCVSERTIQPAVVSHFLNFGSFDDGLFRCFVSFLNVFKGLPFKLTDFEYETLLALKSNLGLNCLINFISNQYPLPETISEAFHFLSFDECSTLEKPYQFAIHMISDKIEEITIDDFDRLSHPILEAIFLSQKKSKNDSFSF